MSFLKVTCDCGNVFTTTRKNVSNCLKCRKSNKYQNCQNCNSRFYTTAGKVLCRVCLSESLNSDSPAYKQKMNRLNKRSCDDVKNWSTDITLLYIKKKHELLTPIDYFRIANVYMAVICNENRFSTYRADEQALLMITELWQLLTFDIKPPQRKGGRRKKLV